MTFRNTASAVIALGLIQSWPRPGMAQAPPRRPLGRHALGPAQPLFRAVPRGRPLRPFGRRVNRPKRPMAK